MRTMTLMWMAICELRFLRYKHVVYECNTAGQNMSGGIATVYDHIQ